MRADAKRNLELVLTTGARMLAEDPSASIAAIAAEAGVDRRTVYRRFASRDELLGAVYEARLDAIEAAIEAARLREAPFPVAIHRYVEGIVEVNRTWPVDLGLMLAEPSVHERRDRAIAEVNAFLRKATKDGHLRQTGPDDWAGTVLGTLLRVGARDLPDLSASQAADVLVRTFVNGFGS
ncbi:TetR/AcrR family transcriptional regulator [Amycolatopsis sp. YIM 10]|uniref:TetR/AcrR family transcriptional regulator n=1 Tax=Amycolatopsis sp. YIM 10 TaxID=2653857 RepID=UPI00129072F2|nr:TetR/AcrR family transcriptional regulator [Amycolatopsis sp. YIM 10]QFU91234.1 Transcriptional regulator, TetR family [Amycolatopsis sp. YIM 10]